MTPSFTRAGLFVRKTRMLPCGVVTRIDEVWPCSPCQADQTVLTNNQLQLLLIKCLPSPTRQYILLKNEIGAGARTNQLIQQILLELLPCARRCLDSKMIHRWLQASRASGPWHLLGSDDQWRNHVPTKQERTGPAKGPRGQVPTWPLALAYSQDQKRPSPSRSGQALSLRV